MSWLLRGGWQRSGESHDGPRADLRPSGKLAQKLEIELRQSPAVTASVARQNSTCATSLDQARK